MERVPDIVANVFTESGIQIGTLTVEEHQKIMKSALRNKNNYIEQAKNAGMVFLKTFFITLKLCVLAAAICFTLLMLFDNSDYDVISDIVFNKDTTLASLGIKSQEEGVLILFSMFFTIILSFKFSFQCALFASLFSIVDSMAGIASLSGKRRMKIFTTREGRDKSIRLSEGRADFSFKTADMFSIVGEKNMFQENIDTEIKKALQEQSDCKIVVKYQESN